MTRACSAVVRRASRASSRGPQLIDPVVSFVAGTNGRAIGRRPRPRRGQEWGVADRKVIDVTGRLVAGDRAVAVDERAVEMAVPARGECLAGEPGQVARQADRARVGAGVEVGDHLEVVPDPLPQFADCFVGVARPDEELAGVEVELDGRRLARPVAEVDPVRPVAPEANRRSRL